MRPAGKSPTDLLCERGGFVTRIIQRNSVLQNYNDVDEDGENTTVWHATIDEAMDWLTMCKPFNRAAIEFRPVEMSNQHHYGIAMYEIEPEMVWLCDVHEEQAYGRKGWTTYKGKRSEFLGDPRQDKFRFNVEPTSLDLFAKEHGIGMEAVTLEDIHDLERWMEKVEIPKRMRRCILKDDDKWRREAWNFGIQLTQPDEPPFYIVYSKGRAHEQLPPSLDEVLDAMRGDITYWLDEEDGYLLFKDGKKPNPRNLPDIHYLVWREYMFFEPWIDEFLDIEYQM